MDTDNMNGSEQALWSKQLRETSEAKFQFKTASVEARRDFDLIERFNQIFKKKTASVINSPQEARPAPKRSRVSPGQRRNLLFTMAVKV